MNIVSIRGATNIDCNDKKQIIEGTRELLLEIENKNNLNRDNVISILFSSTRDLDAEYPAKAARLLGYTQCSLMCFNEMEVIGNMKKCIRIMVLYTGCLNQGDVKHIYLKKTKALRPDLNK